MVYEQLGSRAGQLGVTASLLLWAASAWVLVFAMQANEVAWKQGLYGRAAGGGEIRSLHVRAVIWSLLFVLLQLVAPLLLAFTLRSFYRLRSAVCFSIGVGCGFFLDAFGLLSMLIWLRFRVGVG